MAPWTAVRALTPDVSSRHRSHGLFVTGPLERSAANIAELAQRAEKFIAERVWTDNTTQTPEVAEKSGPIRPK